MAIRAGMAQLVEHFTRNEGVVGSSPISSLKKNPAECVRKSIHSVGFLCLYNDIRNVPEA